MRSPRLRKRRYRRIYRCGACFDRFYAEKLGVDVENLWISQPDNGEQALEIAEQLIRSSAVDIIVIDSVAALTPKAEIEGDMGRQQDGSASSLNVAKPFVN